MAKFFFLFVLLLSQSFVDAAITAEYSISFPEPHTHYLEVELNLTGIGKKPIDLKMPVWTPGSYLVREFSKGVESFTANGKVEKTTKNTWRITPSSESLKVKYKVYGFELSVRTTFIDADMALLSNAAVFCRVDTKEAVTYVVNVSPHASWKQISTSLKSIENNVWKRKAKDFDELVDSPILIGNQKLHTFDVKGVPHTVAMAGTVEYDDTRLISDMQKVCTEACRVVGEHPCTDYTFIIVNATGGSGGLEHANSCVLHTARTSYTNESQYKNFLGLVAHEYFHLWNVKRIRPIELGPFDYDNENYTKQLWISEGFTSYYDDMICQRAGIISSDRFLEITSSNINAIENLPGDKVQPVCESSFDAWIKYYRPNENSNNSTTNYYTKGSLIGLLIDIQIIQASKGSKNLDDLMKALYQKYYKDKKRGFTEAEFQKECELLAGKDLNSFFQKFVYGTDPFNYNAYFEEVGMKLNNANAGRADLGLGAGLGNSGGKTVVSSVVRDTPAWKYGLNVNDEIIAVDGYRINGDIGPFVAGKDEGDTLHLMIARDGIIRGLDVKLEPYVTFAARIERIQKPNETQLTLQKKWLGIP